MTKLQKQRRRDWEVAQWQSACPPQQSHRFNPQHRRKKRKGGRERGRREGREKLEKERKRQKTVVARDQESSGKEMSLAINRQAEELTAVECRGS